jgi:hypothetical protein
MELIQQLKDKVKINNNHLTRISDIYLKLITLLETSSTIILTNVLHYLTPKLIVIIKNSTLYICKVVNYVKTNLFDFNK